MEADREVRGPSAPGGRAGKGVAAACRALSNVHTRFRGEGAFSGCCLRATGMGGIPPALRAQLSHHHVGLPYIHTARRVSRTCVH